MSSIALSRSAVGTRPAVNMWVVAIIVVVPDVHGDSGHDGRKRGPTVHLRRPVCRAV